MATVAIKIKIAWWVRWYLLGLAITTKIGQWLGLGCVPDNRKVAATLQRGIKFIPGKR